LPSALSSRLQSHSRAWGWATSQIRSSVFCVGQALLAFVISGLAILYRYGPSRREARWTWLSVGSLAAAVLWLVSSALFSWYIANFGAYDATYDSLGAAIGMMMWMWISMIVILLGAQLNAEIEHQTSKDSTVGPDKPLGQRGAVKADTMGAAQN
jgi:membrane protein